MTFPSTFMTTSLHRLDAEVLGNRRDLLALLLGRLRELGRPANVEELAGGGEAVADHRIGSAATTARISAAMRSRSSFDISGGPNRPTRPSNVRSGKPASLTVGTSGAAGARTLFVTPRTLIFPVLSFVRTV